MNPITPPDLDRLDKPKEMGEPATDETGRPGSPDAPEMGVPQERTGLETPEVTESPDRGAPEA